MSNSLKRRALEIDPKNYNIEAIKLKLTKKY